MFNGNKTSKLPAVYTGLKRQSSCRTFFFTENSKLLCTACIMKTVCMKAKCHANFHMEDSACSMVTLIGLTSLFCFTTHSSLPFQYLWEQWNGPPVHSVIFVLSSGRILLVLHTTPSFFFLPSMFTPSSPCRSSQCQ